MRGAPGRRRDEGGGNQYVTGGAGGRVFAVERGNQYVWAQSGAADYWVSPESWGAPVLTGSSVDRVPSRLLAARYQVVPFTGRSAELAALGAWATGPAPVAVRAVVGVGGQGKTRLVTRFAQALASAGWAVAGARHRQHGFSGAASPDAAATCEPDVGLLLLVDYADRWPIADLLSVLSAHTQVTGKVRVLLVGRTESGWWPSVARQLHEVGVEDAAPLRLSELAAESTDARRVFAEAVAAFAASFPTVDPAAVPTPDQIDTAAFRHALTVHMAALVAVEATSRGEKPPADPAALSRYLLQRERDGWRELAAAGRMSATVRQVGHATVVAAVTGPVSHDMGLQVLRVTGACDSASAADNLLADHAVAYPPVQAGSVLEALTPDRLAEDFIALTIPAAPGELGSDVADPWAGTAIAALLLPGEVPGRSGRSAVPMYLRHAVTVLVEAAARWPHVATDVLTPALRSDPSLALAGGGAVLSRLAGLRSTGAEVLGLLHEALPAGRHVEFDQAAAVVAQRRLDLARSSPTTSESLASLWSELGNRRHNAGDRAGALAATREAVQANRVLADPDGGNPAAYAPELARSLTNLGARLSESGRRAEALPPTEEAVRISRTLADPKEGDPAVYEPHLASALINSGILLSELGRRAEALPPTEEAVGIYRRLARPEGGSRAVFEPHLASALTNLGVLLSDVGRRAEALPPTQEAVGIYRELAHPDRGNPAAYAPGLARSLTNLGARLAEVGRGQEALEPTTRAVELQRRLADPDTGNPAAHRPGLARSLTNLGARLAEVGRGQEALEPTTEAVQICHELADPEGGDPAAFQPHVASALTNLGVLLSELGRHEEALPPTTQAARVYRELAHPDRGNPAAFQAHLASASSNLGVLLKQLGRHEEALAPTREAVRLYRELADVDRGNPTAFRAQVASASSNLGVLLSEVGRHEEALSQTQAAVEIYRELADPDHGNPAVFLPDLAMSLWALGWVYAERGRDVAAGLAPVEESVVLHESLAAAGNRSCEERLPLVRATADVVRHLAVTGGC